MPDLIAQGPEPRNRWRRHLGKGASVTVGRATGTWSVAWDDRISRKHAQAVWNGATLEVTVLPGARNPIYFAGEQQTGRFEVRPGEHFVIGQTTFSLADERANASLDVDNSVTEQVFTSRQLAEHRYDNADARIEVLSRLPELIASATTDAELHMRLVTVILGGVSGALAAAVVQLRAEGTPIDVLHWDRRKVATGDFHPSDRLIRQALSERKSVVHIRNTMSESSRSAFSANAETDWAFCTPMPGEACAGWAIYVTGEFTGADANRAGEPDPKALRDDLKFTELAATTVGSLRELRLLERNRTSLSQFFSPVVLEQLAGQDPELVLAPREAEVAVMFCDLRGFSRQTEQAGTQLFDLLRRVSQALGVMTHHILEQGGVIGDFHGDAAMGFWGWPLAQADSASRACRAALGIRDEFVTAAQRSGDPLTHFQVGIGIAAGRAVAGKIGTIDQVKVTVFGPVVNLAARLEGMTKQLRAPILVDEAIASSIRRHVPKSVARVRRVAKFKPYGLATAVEVSELLPPEAEFPLLTDVHIATYETALATMQAGDWERAFDLLHAVPAIDRVKDFLTVFIAQHNRTPPENWDGSIPLGSK